MNKTDNAKKGHYTVYILLCADNSLYTGITNNLKQRLMTHTAGEASKYTRVRLPVQLVYVEEVSDRSSALRREYAIKRLSRAEKLQLIKTM